MFSPRSESCYYSYAVILVFMGSLGFVASLFTFLVYVEDFIFHIRDSFIDLFVSVVVFFFHCRNGCVRPMKLGSD